MSVSSVGQSGRLSFPVVTQHHSDSSSIQCDSLSDVFSPTEGVDRLNQTVAHRQDWEDRVAESIQKILVAVEDEAGEFPSFFSNFC